MNYLAYGLSRYLLAFLLVLSSPSAVADVRDLYLKCGQLFFIFEPTLGQRWDALTSEHRSDARAAAILLQPDEPAVMPDLNSKDVAYMGPDIIRYDRWVIDRHDAMLRVAKSPYTSETFSETLAQCTEITKDKLKVLFALHNKKHGHTGRKF